ncbi:hypothetical protein QBC35DRAFT_504865 [Podospora australis]|uniref:DUF7735 domain-containing protein n=1 Tax=Podospora australis TaxID=1536484 RepID=A0AAN6WN17_9PEZI|nr:hypothetical protein QBC35DRAFT_504865 [Podospora australis]
MKSTVNLSILTTAALLLFFSPTTTSAQASLHTLLCPDYLDYPSDDVPDSWMCFTEHIAENFFVPVPRPTGALRSASSSYAEAYRNRRCMLPDGKLELWCPIPGTEEWCGFVTALSESQPELLPAYTSHAISASQYWSAKSADAVSLTEKCPHNWFTPGWFGPGLEAVGMYYLNETLITVDCYEQQKDAVATGGSGAGRLVASVTASPGSRASSAGAPGPTAPVASVSSGGAGRSARVGW